MGCPNLIKIIFLHENLCFLMKKSYFEKFFDRNPGQESVPQQQQGYVNCLAMHQEKGGEGESKYNIKGNISKFKQK